MAHAIARLQASSTTKKRIQREDQQAHAAARALERQNLNQLAFTYDLADATTQTTIGPMGNISLKCHTRKFRSETKGVCCNSEVILEPFPELQPLLWELYLELAHLVRASLATSGSSMVALQ